MWTRNQYLAGECTHAEYYLSIANEVGLTLEECPIVGRVRQSQDPNLNDIPLAVWDRHGEAINGPSITRAFRVRNDFVTKAGLVCLVKQAALAAAGKWHR